MFAANCGRGRDFMPIARVSGDHSADPRNGCATGGWRSRSAKMSAKRRLHRGEFGLAAFVSDGLMDFIREQSAD
jgi:hypothetical protein